MHRIIYIYIYIYIYISTLFSYFARRLSDAKKECNLAESQLIVMPCYTCTVVCKLFHWMYSCQCDTACKLFHWMYSCQCDTGCKLFQWMHSCQCDTGCKLFNWIHSCQCDTGCKLFYWMHSCQCDTGSMDIKLPNNLMSDLTEINNIAQQIRKIKL